MTGFPAARALWLAGLLGLAAPGPAQSGNGGATSLKIWFANQRLNPDPAECRAVFEVERRVPPTLGVAKASLHQLFAGPTAAEAAAGFRSPFSDSTAGLLKRFHIRSGTAYVDLHDLRDRLSVATSSCGAAEFQAQVSRTLLQFPTIRRVIYAIDGEPRRFYEWLNEACGPANDACDPRPFGRRQ